MSDACFDGRVLGDREKALRKLQTDYARRSWNNAGYFDVPGAVMRQLVAEGQAEGRKRGPSAPAEYRSRAWGYRVR